MALLAVRSFLLFNLASFAAAHTAESCEEPVSLLQNDLKSVQRRIAVKHHDEASCQCLNWKQTYDSEALLCGEGLELTTGVFEDSGYVLTAEEWIDKMHNPTKRFGAWRSFHKEMCDHLFRNYDDNKCVRAGSDQSALQWFGESWCYVSRQCDSPGLMAVYDTQAPANAPQVSVKYCAEGTDSMLGDMAPQELFEYGKRMGIELPGDLVKLAYPIERSFFWEDRALHETDLAKLRARGQPVVIDGSGELITDKVIIFGDKVFKMKTHGKFRSTFPMQPTNDYTWDLELLDSEAMTKAVEIPH